MKTRFLRCAAIVLGAGAWLAVSAPGVAMTNWRFDTASCASVTNNGATSGTCSQGSETLTRDYRSDGTEPAVRVSGWANVGPNVQVGNQYPDNFALRQGSITHYSGGLGVDNQGAGLADPDTMAARPDDGEGINPEHAIDSDQHTDMVLFDFQAVGGSSATWRLTDITIGWSQTDRDISVLRYTGAGAPDLTQSYLDDCCSGIDSSLTGDGWEVIGNYQVPGSGSTEGTVDISADTVGLESGYWLVSAYSSAFGSCAYCGRGNDYFKVLSITGQGGTPPPPGGQVPEPLTLLLVASGLPLLRRFRRRV